MPDGNETVVRRLIEEVLNRGQTGLLAEFVAADYIGHDPFGDHYGPEGRRIVVAEYRTAFPDLALTIEDLVTARNTVVWRFTLRGTHAGPFSLDALHLLRQIGAGPAITHVARPTPPDTNIIRADCARGHAQGDRDDISTVRSPH